ncbi:MAG TPA: ABC transporter permease, partial [Phycisphaerae bacterium]|nr:ABC transporter permease [Phycisphaerae bacterium]
MPSPPLTGCAPVPSRGSLVRVGLLLWRFLLWLSAVIERHWQNVLTAFVQIWVNKLRALLTTLGIIIAVTSTITVVSIVQGFGNYVTDMLRGFGTNLIFVIPWNPSGMHGHMMGRVNLDINDIRAVGAMCDKVRRISPIVFSNVTVELGREKAQNIQMRGANEQFQTIRQFFVDRGRFFGPIDVDNGSYVCVLGHDLLELLRCDDSIVDNFVFINGQRFRVAGILEKKGDMMGENQDRVVIIPYTTAIKLLPFARTFMAFMVEATKEEEVEDCSLQMTRVLRQRHNLQPGVPNDFRLFRQDEFLRDFERIKMIATSVLAGVVGISLIVGGIGIMNVMLVSVTERTREIGLRKSVGGRRRDIMSQFLTEAVALAVVGGAIGVGLGYGLCYTASLHPAMVKVTVPYWAVLLAMGFCAGVGVIFGIIPAFKAAILHPIDALRHE